MTQAADAALNARSSPIPWPPLPGDNHPLRETLAVAVPLYVLRFKTLPLDAVFAHTDGVGELLGSKGDVLLYGSKRKGEAAELFNAVAKAIAAMAFVPGGVTVFGLRFEERHPEQEIQDKPVRSLEDPA